MSQAIRDLHTQSQSQETWNTYLAARKQKPAASPMPTSQPWPQTSLRSAWAAAWSAAQSAAKDAQEAQLRKLLEETRFKLKTDLCTRREKEVFTTLNKIREQGPCIDGWERLLRSLGKTKADDEPLSLLTVLDSNGLDDTLWCFRAVDGFDKEKQLFAVWCARQVQHLMTDSRSLAALDVAERFAFGDATRTELDAARDAAQAAQAARDAARSVARSAARGAAEAAARGAAEDAAWAAAEAAAREAEKVGHNKCCDKKGNHI